MSGGRWTNVDTVEVWTDVAASPAEIYDFVLDFEGYPAYSDHLKSVLVDGDGSPGTTYDFTLSWWKVSYTARSVITALDPPHRIEWRLASKLDAHGAWEIEPRSEDGSEDRCRVTWRASYDPESVTGDVVDLPGFVSLGWVLSKVRPVVVSEVNTLVEAAIADLEGERRPVNLSVEWSTDA
jgi:uncharacterized membrane protein